MPVEFKDVSYNYTSQIDTLIYALKNIDLKIEDGEFISLVGHTGCGKSTLVQNINALLKPTEGKVVVFDYEIKNEKIKNIGKLRKRIGMAFQFAENQLFEETIIKDVMFGPINFGVDKDTAMENAKRALEIVGLGEDFHERRPHELSGGQMRRVALAGILAYEPEILILDEPTAGLDPIGQQQMMELFKKLNDAGKTIIMVSHCFNHVYDYSKRVVMLREGVLVFDGTPQDFFEQDLIEENSIEYPDVLRYAKRLGVEAAVYNSLIDGIVSKYGK